MHKSLVSILGGGAAGIGLAIAFKRLGIEGVQVIEKGEVGQSFRDWSPNTQFITPSFNTNGFGFPDLNAVTPNTSPGLFMDEEHLEGENYAVYLEEASRYFNLNLFTNTEIKEVKKHEHYFELISDREVFQSKYLISALGDFSFPSIQGIKGAERGIFYSDLGDYSCLEEVSSYPIIGGNESGFDAAIQLARMGKKAMIFTEEAGIDSQSSDPSDGISLFTKERYREMKELIDIKRGVRIKEITEKGMIDSKGNFYPTETSPVLATGFSALQSPLIHPFFEESNNRAVLTDLDESTICSNLFMVGPQVEHFDVVFCYIYKFRQRFAVIAKEIADRENILVNAQELRTYMDNQMFLDDLSCCETDCIC